MESEVEKKEGRGADLGMIASGSKKGNATMGLIGREQVLNEERRSNGFAVRKARNYSGCNMDCHGRID